MRIYDIITPFSRSQTHSVVANTMAEAEQLFLIAYPYTKIEEIRLHSEYVIVRDSGREGNLPAQKARPTERTIYDASGANRRRDA